MSEASLGELRISYGKHFEALAQHRHLYPSEWLLRTSMGNYEEMVTTRKGFPGARTLDLGFGDGRNFEFLSRSGAEVCGVEISEKIVRLGAERCARLGIRADLRVGENCQIPFPDKYFDIAVASNSLYYIGSSGNFRANVEEVSRVLKPGATLYSSFPKYGPHFLTRSAQHYSGVVYKLTDDPHSLRQGAFLAMFGSAEEVRAELSCCFERISVAEYAFKMGNYEVAMFAVVCENSGIEAQVSEV